MTVAFRYLRARRQEGFISVTAGFSLLGICLGVAALIIVMSVMNGFRYELINRILGFNGHITVIGPTEGIADYADFALDLENVPGGVLVVPMVGQEFAELSTNLNGYIADLGVRAAEGQVWLEEALGREIPVTGDELVQELLTGLNGSDLDAAGPGGGLTELLTQAAPNLGRWFGGALGAVLSGGVTVFLSVLNWLLLPVLGMLRRCGLRG